MLRLLPGFGVSGLGFRVFLGVWGSGPVKPTFFKDFYQEIIMRNPKTVGSLRLRLSCSPPNGSIIVIAFVGYVVADLLNRRFHTGRRLSIL